MESNPFTRLGAARTRDAVYRASAATLPMGGFVPIKWVNNYFLWYNALMRCAGGILWYALSRLLFEINDDG